VNLHPAGMVLGDAVFLQATSLKTGPIQFDIVFKDHPLNGTHLNRAIMNQLILMIIL
jgi:hypothetical protein